MVPSSKLTQRGQRRSRFLLVALAIVGLLISDYLSWVHYMGVVPVCLSGSGGCETVQSSSYATIFGVPVAVIGPWATRAYFSRHRYGVRWVSTSGSL